MKLIRFSLWPGLMLWLLAGCAAKTVTNWEARVGSYTYDQAVQKLGAPDKSAKLDDGSTVAEWRLGSDTTPTIGYKGGVDAGQMDWIKPESVTIYPAVPGMDDWLRLVFGADGKLRSWKKFQRRAKS